jgi:hypothetical protein
VTDYEMTTRPLINHALQAMLNEHGAEGWELTDVEGETAHLRRPSAAEDRVRWQYATVPLVPVARQAIMEQWTEQGFALVVERDNVGYFKQEA